MALRQIVPAAEGGRRQSYRCGLPIDADGHTSMIDYTVEVPEEAEYGIRVRCEEHGESEAFQPGYRTVAFCCDSCGYELEITVHDLLDWRDTGELC